MRSTTAAGTSAIAAAPRRSATSWSGPASRLYFAGDTDLFDAMADLDRIDLAAIPISGWWRRLGPGHLDEARAAEAVARVDPRLVLPIHWGTYSPEDLRPGIPRWAVENGRRFAEELTRRGLEDRLVRLRPGQTARW